MERSETRQMDEIPRHEGHRGGAGPFKDERKREQMIEAAVTLFLDRGFDGTSMAEVARVAGVAKQTVYSHFHNKGALFAACSPAIFRRYGIVSELPMNEPDANEAGDVRAVLSRLGRGYMKMIFDPRTMGVKRVIIGRALTEPEMARIFYEHGPKRGNAILAKALERLVDRGLLREHDTERSAMQFRVMLLHDYHEQLLLNVTKSVEEEVRETHLSATIDDFLRMYGP